MSDITELFDAVRAVERALKELSVKLEKVRNISDKMFSNQNSLYAKKAWITRRANIAKAKAAKAIQNGQTQ